MTIKGKRGVFNLVGIVIVSVWVLMLTHMIKGIQFRAKEVPPEAKYDPSPLDLSERDWMEIYLKGEKVGYSLNRIKPVGTGYMIHEEIFLRLNLMGFPSDIHAVTYSGVDRNFLLKNFRFSTTSGLVRFQVSGRVEGDWIYLERGKGMEKRIQKIRCPTPPTVSVGLTHFFKGRRLKVGQSFRFFLFDPSSLSQKEILVRVMGRGSIEIYKRKYPAYRLESEILGQRLTFWIDEKGNVMKEEGFMGLSLVKSNAARAPRGLTSTGGQDFYKAAAIGVKTRLKDPGRLSYLKVKIDGLEQAQMDLDVLNEGRQRYRKGILEVSRELLPKRGQPADRSSVLSEGMAPYLAPELFVESDQEPIREMAAKITSKVGSPIEAARKLTDWVYRQVEKRPVVSVPSALQVLNTKAGDCNEHAVLLTALLRASGIPSRLCVGLVYARGRFFYHAWTEGYLGSWISMDATLNQMPVDASHIKFVQGGLERQVQLIGLIGRLGLEVIDYRYDSVN